MEYIVFKKSKLLESSFSEILLDSKPIIKHFENTSSLNKMILYKNSVSFKLILQELKEYGNHLIQTINFYHFIEIDSKILKTMVKIVGEILEFSQDTFEIPDTIISLFKIHYPSLMYDVRYKDLFIFNNKIVNSSDIYKNISLFSLYNIEYFKSRNSIDENFGKSLNLQSYCFWLKMKNQNVAKKLFDDKILTDKRINELLLNKNFLIGARKAIKYKCKKFLIYLFKKGFNPQKIINYTCLSGNIKMVNFLNQYVNIFTYQGFSKAIASHNFDLVKLFCEKVGNTMVDTDIITISCSNNTLDSFIHLLKFFVVDDKSLETFFLHACSYGCKDILSYLIENFTYKDEYISNQLESAFNCDLSDIAEILFNKFNWLDRLKRRYFTDAVRLYKPNFITLLGKNTNIMIRSNLLFLNLIKNANFDKNYDFILFTLDRFKQNYIDNRTGILNHLPLQHPIILKKLYEIFENDGDMTKLIFKRCTNYPFNLVDFGNY